MVLASLELRMLCLGTDEVAIRGDERHLGGYVCDLRLKGRIVLMMMEEK